MAVIYKHSHAPLPELAPEIAHLEALTHRLLGKDPRDRYQSASELLDAIDALNESPLRHAVAGE
jgi:hypothetical protein